MKRLDFRQIGSLCTALFLAGCSANAPSAPAEAWYQTEPSLALVGVPEKAALPAAAAPSAEESYDVVRIVDGDTLVVNLPGGGEDKVRLIGIDAPEVAKAGAEAECGAAEAETALNGLAVEAVILIADPSQGDRDKYSRLLRYAESESGLDLNRELLRLGLAREYTYDSSKPYARQAMYRSEALTAKTAGLGIYGALSCAP